MLKEMKLIPTTETSKPFAAAAETCAFDKLGYIEDEYFQTGTANVYQEDGLNNVSPIYEGAPYTTRVLIRRPADPARFSGNVVLEILNSSARIDIDRQWVNSWPFFTRNGDIYVGITSKGHVVDSLKAYDPVRYADINWDNPMPDREIPEEAKNEFMGYFPQYELGLFWDMLLDLTKLLRSDSDMNPIKTYGKSYIYLTGWSQSTAYVNRMIRSFVYRPENCENGLLYDGYLNGGGSAGLAPLSNSQPFVMQQAGFPQGGVMGAREPFMAVNTESENRSSFWYGDFDEPGFKFRTWQIAGSSHDSKYNLLDYYGEDGLAMLDSIGIQNGYFGVDGAPLDAPYEYVFNAAYYALYKWVRDGIPAPHAPKIETYMGAKPSKDPFGSFVGNLTDAFGNCRGGIRTPALNYPTCRYVSWSTTANGTIAGAFGRTLPFSPEFLRTLYGTLENYRTLVEADYDRLVAQGFLLQEDKTAFIERIVGNAKSYGLA